MSKCCRPQSHLWRKTFEERVEHIHKEYVAEALDEHRDAGLMPRDLLARYEEALVRIKRRLGGARLADLTLRLQQAFAGKTDHRRLDQLFIAEYYDPMYDFQLQRKTARIQFRGCHADVAAFLRAKSKPPLHWVRQTYLRPKKSSINVATCSSWSWCIQWPAPATSCSSASLKY